MRKESLPAGSLPIGMAYLLLYFFKGRFASGAVLFGVMDTALQLGLDLAIVWTVYSVQGPARLLLAFVFSAITDAIYGTCLQILGITQFHGGLELLINGFYLAFLVTLTAALAEGRRLGKPLVLSFFFAVVSMALLGPRILSVLTSPQTQAIHLLCLIAESLLLGVAITRPRDLVALGACLIAAFGFVLQSIELYSGLASGLPVELLWTGGQFALLVGLRQRRDMPGRVSQVFATA